MIRDQKLRCCPITRADKDEHMRVEAMQEHMADTDSGARFFRWRDAKWPWC